MTLLGNGFIAEIVKLSSSWRRAGVYFHLTRVLLRRGGCTGRGQLWGSEARDRSDTSTRQRMPRISSKCQKQDNSAGFQWEPGPDNGMKPPDLCTPVSRILASGAGRQQISLSWSLGLEHLVRVNSDTSHRRAPRCCFLRSLEQNESPFCVY